MSKKPHMATLDSLPECETVMRQAGYFSQYYTFFSVPDNMLQAKLNERANNGESLVYLERNPVGGNYSEWIIVTGVLRQDT